MVPQCVYQRTAFRSQFFHHVGSRAGTQGLRLPNKHFYLLSYLLALVFSLFGFWILV